VGHDELLDTVRAAELIPLAKVPSIFPNRIDRSTVFRWALKGCCGIRLKTVSVGRTRHTSERWLMQFFERVASARDERSDFPVKPAPSPRRRTSGAPAASTELHSRTARILRNHGLSDCDPSPMA